MRSDSPYFYLIGWRDNNRWYAGCRYAKKANPDDFWVKYFTSSSYVKAYRELNGEPDYIEVVPFATAEEVRVVEFEFLKDKFNTDQWLNKANGLAWDSSDPDIRSKMSDAKKGKKLSKSHCAAISAGNTGKKMSDSTREKMSLAATGKKKSAEHRESISRVQRGKKRGPKSREAVEKTASKQRGIPKGPQSEERKASHKIRMKQWWAERKVNEVKE